MSREQIIDAIKRCEPALRARGVSALSLFGSIARGDDTPESDVDVLIDVAPEARPRFSLIDHAGVMNLLEDALGRKTDVAVRSGLRPRTRANIEPDEVRVF